MCERRLADYDSVKWSDYTASFSDAMKRWAVDSTSIYLGMDYSQLSAHCMLGLLRHNQVSEYVDATSSFYCMDGDMNEVWFNVWQKYLESKGVHFHMSTPITKINSKGNKIESIHIENDQVVDADIFVNSLDVENLARLYPEIINPFHSLAKRGYQIQTQVLFNLEHRLNETRNTVYIYPDSPWFLMTRHEGSLWDLKDRDMLSVGIGMWNVPGLNGKTANECMTEELASECWAQMIHNDSPFNSDISPRWNVWYTFHYSEEEKRLVTNEPKFSNNINTLALRPDVTDNIYTNLYHATAYCKTDTDIFNMESAAEAGVVAAAEICGENVVITHSKPNFIFRLCQCIDDVIYRG